MSNRLRNGALITFILYAACAGGSATARAQLAPAEQADADAYRTAIAQALTEYDLGHFEEARALFQKAHAIEPSARTFRGLGKTEFELRNYPACIDAMQQALDSSVKPLEGALRAETEDLLQRAKEFVGRFSLSIRPVTAATVLLDGAPVAPRDNGMALSIGEHTLDVRADGYASERRKFTVSSGMEERVVILLKPASATGGAHAGAALRKDSGTRPLYKNPWLWTGVGLVVAGAAAAGIGIAMTRDPEERRVSGSPELGGLVQTLWGVR